METAPLTVSQLVEQHWKYVFARQTYQENLVKYSNFLYDEDLELENRKQENQNSKNY